MGSIPVAGPMLRVLKQQQSKGTVRHHHNSALNQHCAFSKTVSSRSEAFLLLGCLPLITWSNQLVNCLGKWYTKCRTAKFHPRIAFSISTNQLPKNDRNGLKLVSKNALKKWNMNFCLEYSFRIINRITFSNVPFLLEIFRRNDPKGCVPFTSQPDL